MPERLLEIVAIGLRDPAAPAPTFGADDATVRAALPQLAARAGQPPELASGVVALLWEPGRDELGPLHSDRPDTVRLAQELGEYSQTGARNEALLAAA